MAKQGAWHIGTSGWHYDHWIGPFYPEKIAKKELLTFYKDRLGTVEINNSFYHLPSAETFDQWRQTVGNNFRFAVKASRYITHMKKLKDPRQSLAKFLEAIQSLKSKLGPVLFQLPPNWNVNTDRLREFLQELPGRHRYTFELRDQSWLTDEVYALLSEANAAFCIYDFKGYSTPKIVTADWVYVRLHGHEETAYTGSYSKQRLKTWARHIQEWIGDGKDVYCYFDNDQNGYAVRNAMTLQELMNS